MTLRAAAPIALLAGAVGSIGLMFHASRHPPPLLLVLFTIWVLAPFAALGLAYVISTRWPLNTQRVLHALMLFVTVGSLAIYGDDAMGHRRPQAAFVYVAVPAVSWLLIAGALLAARLSRRGS